LSVRSTDPRLVARLCLATSQLFAFRFVFRLDVFRLGDSEH
jgi:hypothetical protein